MNGKTKGEEEDKVGKTVRVILEFKNLSATTCLLLEEIARALSEDRLN